MVFWFIKDTFLNNVDKFVIRWFERAGAKKQKSSRIFSFILDFDQLNEIEPKLINFNLDLHSKESHCISIWLSKDPFAVIRKLLKAMYYTVKVHNFDLQEKTTKNNNNAIIAKWVKPKIFIGLTNCKM